MKKIIIVLVILFISGNKGIAQDMAGSFMPSSGKYIVSGWVKEELPSTARVSTFTSEISISIKEGFASPFYSATLKPSGSIIDGWQRIIGVIEIPTLAGKVEPNLSLGLDCKSLHGDCYFDDIRFYPYNGNMKSFVYDEDTQRLMAELDENNYATFYEYDLEGGLVRVKKETERGVFTIQETRSNTFKK